MLNKNDSTNAKPSADKRAFVLLSGGLDSTTCLYKALYDFKPHSIDVDVIQSMIDRGAVIPCTWVEAVSINYGQRHNKEMEYAAATCDRLGIKHTILNLADILGGSMLTDSAITIPDVSYNDLPTGVSPTYVPFRNGILLSLITAHAQKWINIQNANWSSVTHPEKPSAGIYFGAHSEDAANWAYPDCTPEFIGSMANAIYIGSYNQIRLYTPLQWLMKTEIVELGSSLGVDFADTWSCYKGEALHCGVCPTCRSRREAFFVAGINDPTEYAQAIPIAAE